MYEYTPVQWLLFFYVYCFLGWCWETAFVSIQNKKFVNRGFMVGPWLPIYGSGAVAVLWIVLPVRDNIFLVFLFGMLAATILEYCTGTVMEALFKVRYWDYSNHPFNLNGHICLLCSLGWGVFSVLLAYVLHRPVEFVVMSLDDVAQKWITAVISVLMSIDFALSFRAAMDIKTVLENITQSNAEIRKLKKRLDVFIAVAYDDSQQLIKKYDEKLSQTKQMYHELYENIRQKFSFIDRAKNGIGWIKAFSSEDRKFEYERLKLGFAFINKLNEERKKYINVWVKRIIRGNPDFSSKKYGSAVEELKDIIFRKKNSDNDKENDSVMVRENYADIRKRIDEACLRSGRKPSEVTLIAVSKTKPVEMIEELAEYGVVDFGENKVQEMCRKIEVIDKPLNWHMIGHLQRNKVKYIVDKAYLIHSVDSLRLAEEIQKEAVKAGVVCRVLIEVNIGGEESKDGVSAADAPELVEEISRLSNVKVVGLMTVAPPVDNPEDNRVYFAGMKKLAEDIKAMNLPNVEMNELSMGMTDDFEVAVEEGATMVRVGTAIFGERDYGVQG